MKYVHNKIVFIRINVYLNSLQKQLYAKVVINNVCIKKYKIRTKLNILK